MKNVVVVGVGALGSHVVQFLRNCDVKMKVIDYDRIEQKNVQSQFHSKSGVGKNKTQALQQLMQFLFGVKLDIVPHKLVSDNINNLLKDADLVIDCLDNAQSRLLVQKYCRENNIACLHGALDDKGSFCRVVWDQNYKIDTEPDKGAATCENGEHLPFIAMGAAFLARSAQEYLVNQRQIGFEINPNSAFCT